jgi:hypothetical protein
MVYEYTVMVETGLLDAAQASAASPEAVSKAQGDGVNGLLQKVARNAAQLAGGGWEVFSFDQLIVGNKLVTTFLLRRERR